MHNSYTFKDNKVSVNENNNNIIEKNNHNLLEEELNLENEIEILMSEYSFENKKEFPNLKSIPRIKRICLFLLFNLVICLYSATWLGTMSTLLKIIASIGYVGALAISELLIEKKYDKLAKETMTHNSYLKLLEDEITKKTEKLNKIKDNQKGVMFVDNKTHMLDINEYRDKLRMQLNAIKKYIQMSLINLPVENEILQENIRRVSKEHQELILKYVIEKEH